MLTERERQEMEDEQRQLAEMQYEWHIQNLREKWAMEMDYLDKHIPPPEDYEIPEIEPEPNL
jgi:hypothetical protein